MGFTRQEAEGMLNPLFRAKYHHAGQGRSMHHAVDRQAYHRSITVHTHGSVEVDPTIQVGLTTTPSLLGIRVSVEAGKAARTARAIAHLHRSGDDGYIFCTS